MDFNEYDILPLTEINYVESNVYKLSLVNALLPLGKRNAILFSFDEFTFIDVVFHINVGYNHSGRNVNLQFQKLGANGKVVNVGAALVPNEQPGFFKTDQVRIIKRDKVILKNVTPDTFITLEKGNFPFIYRIEVEVIKTS
ncbi:MAG: hypothetical protein Harvfovirus26_14 [Harvfovirus sp.]|uniref:Uncharacterized protein n=1 Tax=Harvfovirus sp. TaxID=2487768 RepID=A0A3G5A256_9VIRU|nr:MAG: hypothetical protein Harvfovirus26_14 [Harvfovirus sp.]